MAARARKSKKRSVANSKAEPPRPPVIFVERSLGKQVVADVLRASGVRVEVHDDHFAPDAEDVEWIPEVGRRGWLVITKDKMIRYRAPERVALIAGGVRAFVLTAGNLTGQAMGEILVRALPRIARLSAREAQPFIARIGRDGSVSIIERGEQRPTVKSPGAE